MSISALEITLAGFAPGLFWLWYIRRKDHNEPEPRGIIARVFGLGCASAFLVLWLRPYIDPFAPPNAGWHRDLIDAFLLTAVPEETAKFLAFLIGAWWCSDLDEPLDGIVYGAAAALGFASAENVFYLIQTGDPALMALRAFTATLAHVGFTASLCFSVSLSRFGVCGNRWLIGIGAFIAAVVFHGGYNLFLWRGPQYTHLALLGILPLSLALLGAKIKWSQKQSTLLHPRPAKV